MRRAISCVYCAPKSRIRILSRWMFCIVGIRNRESGIEKALFALTIPHSLFLLPTQCSVESVVRCFFRDRHVVHMRLADARAGHAHKLRLAAHFFDRRTADVTHCRTQATRELVHDAAQWPTIRHATLDAFW